MERGKLEEKSRVEGKSNWRLCHIGFYPIIERLLLMSWTSFLPPLKKEEKKQDRNIYKMLS